MSQPITPSVSRDVHYVAYNGRCLAGKIIGVNDDGSVDLVVWTNLHTVNGIKNFGEQFHQEVKQDETAHAPGTWHTPERV